MPSWWFSYTYELMGSIGTVMKWSAFSESLETVYGPNAVIHMVSGKAVARALRGHYLVEAALMIKLLETFVPNLVSSTEEYELDFALFSV